jgi:wyosine [tRNA(Phe)-imidazoG37] synthetase (radical SAM superfamily)
LGRSLGINNIPPKVCTYSCVYCQLGRTIKMQVERQAFHEPETILQDVLSQVEKARQAGESIDYLSFVPDGEPTLDVNLGHEIELLKPLGIKIAVITNASLIWQEEVREALMQADWVSLKMDAAREGVWRKVDRPHGALQLASILDGALTFSRAYRGELVTETMLVDGINDSEDHLTELAQFLVRLRPAMAYVAIPTRPPAEEWVQPASEDSINRAYQVFHRKMERVEYLIGYEGNAFAFTGDVEQDLLSITAVHPMREEAVSDFLARAGAEGSVVPKLIAQGQMVETEYKGRKYFMRKLHSKGAESGEDETGDRSGGTAM